MKSKLDQLRTYLQRAPSCVVEGKLVRMVPHLDLGSSPDWLYASGKANRYNPWGIECVYFSEARETAQAEYDAWWRGLPEEDQPATAFRARVRLGRVLDLTDKATLKALGLKKVDLTKSWRRVKTPTVTQLLGQAVKESGRFSAIRYPSVVAPEAANVVIFRDAVKKPDSVKILGKGTKPLQEWP